MGRGRPSKNMNLNSKKLSAEDKQIRLNAESVLKGNEELIKPSARLNTNQKKIFNYIVNELKNAKILGNLDTFMLETTCIAIDRLQNIEKLINADFERICDKDLMQAKTKYSADFFKAVGELSLSPQARAKMGILALNQKIEEADPLLKVLKGG